MINHGSPLHTSFQPTTDKMAKLEQRIERFDDVLKHTTASSSELEETLLKLHQDLVSAASPRTPVATS